MICRMVIGQSLILWNSRNRLSKFQLPKSSKRLFVLEPKKVKALVQDQGKIEKTKAAAKSD